jgi:hypothetical protein
MKVIAYGGGTNSTAMLVWMYEQKIKPDLIIFADTGGEKPHTYDHIKKVNAWCHAVSFPEIIITKKRGKIYVGETLEENCLRKKMLPSIAYGYKSCSLKYKVQPQDMYCNNNADCKKVWISGGKVQKYIGYDADEERRAKIKSDDKYEYKYPLIETEWGRGECVEAIKRQGLPQPGKSACFFCPSSKKSEIITLKDQYPDLLERALKMEKQAELTSVKGLGRNFSWQDFLNKKEDSHVFSDVGKESVCGCYDGDD